MRGRKVTQTTKARRCHHPRRRLRPEDRIFDGHHSIIRHLFSPTAQRPSCFVPLTSKHSYLRRRHKEEASTLSHTYRRNAAHETLIASSLHARRALAHALPPTAAAADLTHIFRTPSHWSSASRSYQTWKAPAPTQRYTSTMPSVPCARRSRSPRSTSPSTRWRMDPR